MLPPGFRDCAHPKQLRTRGGQHSRRLTKNGSLAGIMLPGVVGISTGETVGVETLRRGCDNWGGFIGSGTDEIGGLEILGEVVITEGNSSVLVVLLPAVSRVQGWVCQLWW